MSEIVDGRTLQGLLISVTHRKYGTVFAAMTEGDGEIVTTTKQGELIPWLTTNEILQQLRKFGFDIVYTERLTLNNEMIDYLIRVMNLGYDKITKVVVMLRSSAGLKYRIYPIGLKSEYNQDLLSFGKTITSKLFNDRLSTGHIICLEDIDNPKLRWNWLDAMYNISDILAENADIEDMQVYEGRENILEEPITAPEYNTDISPCNTLEVPYSANYGLTEYSG